MNEVAAPDRAELAGCEEAGGGDPHTLVENARNVVGPADQAHSPPIAGEQEGFVGPMAGQEVA
ncbi:MAG TPA: hypothetical protein VMZ51_09275 [Acidimicrobiales bacterium]|nr:hypothetical protein [Acidimicrobiales bacterium]